MGGADTEGLCAGGLGAALGAAGQPGILVDGFGIGLVLTCGKAGDIAFRASEGLTVFLLFVIGDE